MAINLRCVCFSKVGASEGGYVDSRRGGFALSQTGLTPSPAIGQLATDKGDAAIAQRILVGTMETPALCGAGPL